MGRKRPLFIAAVAIAAIAASCGPDENPNIITPSNNTETNNSNDNNTETNNAETNNTDNSNSSNNLPVGCEGVEIEDFGAESFEIEREFFQSSSPVLLSCREDVGEIATNGAYVAKVQYPQPTYVDIRVEPIVNDGGIPPRPAIEIRKGSCGQGEVTLCENDLNYSELLEADTPYYIVVNGLLNSDGLKLTLDATPIICTPDETSCTDGVVETCNGDGSAVQQTVCPGDCMGDACAGDECTAPIVVAPEVNGATIVLEGNRNAFSNSWDAMGGDGCVLYEDDPPADSPYSEFFLLVEGVEAGQTVIIDAEQSHRLYGFFFIESCQATTCLDAFVFDLNGSNRAAYVATTDGDVLVAVEALDDDVNRAFIMEVQLRQ